MGRIRLHGQYNERYIVRVLRGRDEKRDGLLREGAHETGT